MVFQSESYNILWSIEELQMTAYHVGISHAEGRMIATKLYQRAIVVEYLWIAVLVCPVDGVDVVWRLITVVHTLLVAQHLFASIDERHALGGEDEGLSQEVETYNLVGGDARDACFQAVYEAHIVVAAYVSYHLRRRICPCSLRVVHLVEVYLRMVDATSDTKLYALLVVGNGAKDARLMVVAERTTNAIAHIVAESSYAVKLLDIGFRSQFLCRISTLSCAPSLTIYIYVRVYGVESFANEVHGFDVVNAHEVEAEAIDVVFLSPI